MIEQPPLALVRGFIAHVPFSTVTLGLASSIAFTAYALGEVRSLLGFIEG
ncbi:hypothetical protein [Massilia putida]|nr:hypothetical protein [Massilia putida]